ncbi:MULTISPECIES: FAD-binding oxidoreductase [unclassified Clostridium]|uniref:NAD(P)/FAD-dependent oxidoreductase n=1 Tax=unclassified Clostridium TaxID=2614128 RepID=UPI001C8B188B|nr:MULTISPECIES: FAD-dependent oxidoreductase [unclassified Clostridium]MBX9138836.1 FAD-dependent oxidoreductase [Clostridium sp. K12(2020)]MBX9145602.1 FAD-dependent oxidoreductase [Clostridium sp. K13]
MAVQFVQGNPLFININKIKKQYNYLTEDVETDVIIVGGGVTGSILGYYFSKEGIDTVILEKSRIAHGSTSITTSLLQYELDSNLMALTENVSLDHAINSYKLGVKALDEIEKFIKEYGNKCDYIKRDTLLYTAKKLEIEELYQEYKLRKENGFNVKFINEDDNPFSFDLKAGVYGIEGGAELDPFKYTHHLLEVACNNGLRVYENTPVIDVKYNKDYVEAITSYNHKVRGKILVLATGFNTKLFTDRNFGVKTYTYNIVTKPLKNIEGWFNNVLIRDNEDTYNYFRTTPDNRIIAGGEDTPFTDNFNPKIAMEKYDILEQRVKNMFNKIDYIEIEYKYCGTFDSTKDNLGFIGKDPKNDKLWYGLGYGANGILFAILGGMMLPKLYRGEVSDYLKYFNICRFD